MRLPPTRDLEEGLPMHREYTAVVKQEDDWWIGWVEEVPGVNCQERTHGELMESLQVTLREALDLNRHDALQAAGEGFIEEKIAV
jgi:predicted RNase H-like HicB family nuclease